MRREEEAGFPEMADVGDALGNTGSMELLPLGSTGSYNIDHNMGREDPVLGGSGREALLPDELGGSLGVGVFPEAPEAPSMAVA
jgi:hypothetical protein